MSSSGYNLNTILKYCKVPYNFFIFTYLDQPTNLVVKYIERIQFIICRWLLNASSHAQLSFCKVFLFCPTNMLLKPVWLVEIYLSKEAKGKNRLAFGYLIIVLNIFVRIRRSLLNSCLVIAIISQSKNNHVYWLADGGCHQTMTCKYWQCIYYIYFYK